MLDIVSVRFGGYFTPEIKAELERYQSLQMLTLNDCAIKSLENFPQLPSLIRLDMVFNQITGESLHCLKGCRHLQTLMLGANKIEKLEHIQGLSSMRQILQLDFINNPVSKVAGYRNQVFSFFPTCMILDTLDRGGKDAYNNASMTQAASRVPDSLFDKSAPPPPAPIVIPPAVSHTHKEQKKKLTTALARTGSLDSKSGKVSAALKKEASKVSKTDSKSRPLKRNSKNSVKSRGSKGAKISKMPIGYSGRTKSARAGLTFPVARIHRHIKSTMQGLRVANGSAVFMAATLEYLAAELLEIAGNEAKRQKKQRISPQILRSSLKFDDQLDELLKHATISMN